MMLNDLPCRTAWRKGKHVYWVPRHGPDYKRGQDWQIVVRVKLFPGAEGHPVAKLRGHGSYRGQRRTKFSFRSPIYA